MNDIVRFAFPINTLLSLCADITFAILCFKPCFILTRIDVFPFKIQPGKYVWFHAQPSYDCTHKKYIHTRKYFIYILAYTHLYILPRYTGIKRQTRASQAWVSFSHHDIRTLVFEPLSFLRISHIPKMNK